MSASLLYSTKYMLGTIVMQLALTNNCREEHLMKEKVNESGVMRILLPWSPISES